MPSTPSLSLFPGPLWPRVVTSDWVLSMGQIELFNIQTELLKSELFNHLTVCKQTTV